MSNKQTKPATQPAPAKKEFTPTFRRYDDMNSGEQAAFRQGATTVSNKVKENLGLKQKKVA